MIISCSEAQETDTVQGWQNVNQGIRYTVHP